MVGPISATRDDRGDQRPPFTWGANKPSSPQLNWLHFNLNGAVDRWNGSSWDLDIWGGGGVTDHGALTGITPDDDHPQYHTDARGDARYTAIAHASDTSNPHSVTAAQAGADPAGTASSGDAAHVAAGDPHTQYHNNARGDARYTLIAHATDTTNPHNVTPAQIGATSNDIGNDSTIPGSDVTAALDATAVAITGIDSALPVNVVLAADFTTSSIAAVTVDNGGGDDLTWTPAANKTYEVIGHIMFQSDTLASAVRIGLAWPGGMSDNAGWVFQPNTLDTNQVQRHFGGSGAAQTASTAVPAANTTYMAQVRATIVMGASPTGSFKIQCKAEVGTAVATIRAGSYFSYREIS